MKLKMKKVFWIMLLSMICGALVLGLIKLLGASGISMAVIIGGTLLPGAGTAVVGSLAVACKNGFSRLIHEHDAFAIFPELICASAIFLGAGVLLLYGECFR